MLWIKFVINEEDFKNVAREFDKDTEVEILSLATFSDP